MEQPNQPAHLEPSELGTKEYWDKLYTNEIANHAANPADIGTVWFDDSDAETKTLALLAALADDAGRPLPRDTTSFLDLGCGNGSLLFRLRGLGDGDDSDEDADDDDDDNGPSRDIWTGRMLGVDYSPQSVALAKQVAVSRTGGQGQDAAAIDFAQWDAISGPLDTVLNGAQQDGWDVVLDKGTFDAISLSAEADARGRRLCESYRDRVARLVRPGGRFVITSCNWTEQELEAWFASSPSQQDAPAGNFVVAHRVNYRTFSFGGVKGQTISTLCFVKPA